MSARFLHFKKTSGLKPRQFDDYDSLCLKYARKASKRKAEQELREWSERNGGDVSDDLDNAWSHGLSMQLAENEGRIRRQYQRGK